MDDYYYFTEDGYHSYSNYLEDFNPDDYESDYWEDMLPDVDKMAEEFERQMEADMYGYENDLSAEELDKRLDEEFYGYRGEKPEGCRACGNPAYPKCKASCPLFDD